MVCIGYIFVYLKKKKKLLRRIVIRVIPNLKRVKEPKLKRVTHTGSFGVQITLQNMKFLIGAVLYFSSFLF